MATSRRVAVMAHFDPRGEVAPHVRHHAAALAEAVDEVVFVSTAALTEESRGWLRAHGRLVERGNYGYDFYSYKVGLDAVADLASYDEVVVCNDSFVGPFRRWESVFEEMATHPVDFWGLTQCHRIGPHVQSYFVVFRPWVVGSRAFTDFWSQMAPVSDRRQVIHRYEVGMSRRLVEAGFRWGSYFTDADGDERLARRRMVWWTAHRQDFVRAQGRGSRWEWFRREATSPLNPSISMADSSLADGRLPVLKIDTLRYDPYGLGADRLLELARAHYPVALDGVPEFLADTERFYPVRAGQALRRTPPGLRWLRRTVEYRDAS